MPRNRQQQRARGLHDSDQAKIEIYTGTRRVASSRSVSVFVLKTQLSFFSSFFLGLRACVCVCVIYDRRHPDRAGRSRLSCVNSYVFPRSSRRLCHFVNAWFIDNFFSPPPPPEPSRSPLLCTARYSQVRRVGGKSGSGVCLLLAYLDVFADQAQMDSPQCWCFFLGGKREGAAG